MTAAFIGPGTVTTCSRAGGEFGFSLLWALLFSTLATILLQEMTARLGLVSGRGLGEAFRGYFQNPAARGGAGLLILGAIGIGCAAFQTGNLLGASMGIEIALGGNQALWGILLGAIVGLLLFTGSYRLLEKILIGLVFFMSAAFLATAVSLQPPLKEVFRGMLVPSLSRDSLLLLVALMGTTIVPYNLFLHSGAVLEKWKGSEHLGQARCDLILFIAIGGIISSAIIVTAASSGAGTGKIPQSGADLAVQLEPFLGSWAQWVFAAGIFAAGLSSAITAPLAAAYAVCEVLGQRKKGAVHRLVWMAVLLTGVLFCVAGASPIPVIVFAQAANGLLLPVIAIFLLAVMNRRDLLGRFANSWKANLGGILIVLVTLLAGGRLVGKALGML